MLQGGQGPQLDELVSDELAAGVPPSNLEAFGFAERILPAFRLVRALFSSSEVDTCLKLMLLYELSRAEGRANIERVRALNRYLAPERVDTLVSSLKTGGWLQLRAADHTYALSPVGLHLLGLLYAADFGNLSPANALARAAQNAEFGSTLAGAEGAEAYLLDQLLVLLQNQVDEAQRLLQTGSPARMIAWSRREHRQQLETIRQVVAALYERLDDASHEFARVVRLHEAMQDIVRMHGSLHARLRDWNLERLFATETGYSLVELAEAARGVDEAWLDEAWSQGIVSAPVLAPSLGTDEIRVRFEGARRRLRSQREEYVYAPPEEGEVVTDSDMRLDAANELRARVTAALSGRSAADPPVELEAWLRDQPFGVATFDLATLARLCVDERPVRLDDGRRARAELSVRTSRGIPPEELLGYLERRGCLRRLPGGWFARIRVRIIDEEAVIHGEESAVDGADNGLQGVGAAHAWRMTHEFRKA